jgi:hypothetical protein
MQTDRWGIDEGYEDAMGASKGTRLPILTATDGDFTSAGQGNADLWHTAWLNDAARLTQVIRGHFQRRRLLRQV